MTPVLVAQLAAMVTSTVAIFLMVAILTLVFEFDAQDPPEVLRVTSWPLAPRSDAAPAPLTPITPWRANHA